MKNIPTTMTKQIEYQDSDYTSRYKLSSLVSWLADLATENAIKIAFWNESLQNKYGWVLSKQTLKLNRPIKTTDFLTVTTRAKPSMRIQFFRTYDFFIGDEPIGGIYSVWAFIDIEKRRITKPEKAGVVMPECEDYTSYVEKIDNINQAIPTTKIETRKVNYSDVDINQHMNNARYIEWSMDLLPFEIHRDYYISELTMHFRKEIAPLTLIDLYFGMQDNEFKVEFKKDDVTHFEMSGILKKDA